MTFEEAKKKLQECGQGHVLRFYDELSGKEQEDLLAQIDRTDFHILENSKNRGKELPRGEFSPLSCMEIPEIQKREEDFKRAGLSAIKERKVAACLLAGGMGTRLGSSDPKGMYDIGLTRHVYIFQRLIENLLDVVKEAEGTYIPLYIMTSEKNHDQTVTFLKEHAFFGYPEKEVTFFTQEMAPACDYNGKVYMESKYQIATSPNGNAGWYLSLQRAGLTKKMEEEGILWINTFSVDNVLQRICDPVFVGATITQGVECGAKVVKKVTKDEKGEPAYNFGVTMNYLFYEPAMKRIAGQKLPLHVVEKKINHIDEAGNPVQAQEINGIKFEQLVLDMIHELKSCLPYEVVREHEFAPIKNKTGVDSVESARELCKKEGIAL